MTDNPLNSSWKKHIQMLDDTFSRELIVPIFHDVQKITRGLDKLPADLRGDSLHRLPPTFAGVRQAMIQYVTAFSCLLSIAFCLSIKTTPSILIRLIFKEGNPIVYRNTLFVDQKRSPSIRQHVPIFC